MTEAQDGKDAKSAAAEEYYDDFARNWDAEMWDARSRERAEIAHPMMAPGGSLLVIGFGNGAEAGRFRDWDYEVTVLDISGLAVEKAKERGFSAVRADLEQDDLPGEYDQIVCFEVIEHLRDAARATQALKQALRPGGGLFVSLPNEFHLQRRLAILLGRPDFAAHDWPHLRFFNLRACRRLFEDCGLEVCEVRKAPLFPPRMKILRKLNPPLCGLFPGLFTFSYIFHLRPAGQAAAT